MPADGHADRQTDRQTCTLAAILRTLTRGEITTTVSWPLYCVSRENGATFTVCVSLLCRDIHSSFGSGKRGKMV